MEFLCTIRAIIVDSSDGNNPVETIPFEGIAGIVEEAGRAARPKSNDPGDQQSGDKRSRGA
jgi:hypothetical protein